MAKKFLGEMLLESGYITPEQLSSALATQQNTGERIGAILKGANIVTEEQILACMEFELGIPYIDLGRERIDSGLSAYVPVNIARRHKLVPVRFEDGQLTIAMEDPFSFMAIEDVQMISGFDVVPAMSTPDAIAAAIDDLYGNEFAVKAIEDFSREVDLEEIVKNISDETVDEVGNAPIVRLVTSVIERAILIGASDIHIEPSEKKVRVRYRIDGQLMQVLTVPKEAQNAIIARIKIVSNLNIAEKRLPQDGRYQMSYQGHDVDLRVSSLPTVFGEKIVMRLLDRSSFLRPKAALGFTEENLEKFDKLVQNPHGIILVTGPTGSGKSTTLYTMLHELNQEYDNIITVEDPVEYMMTGLNQVQVNIKAGLDFGIALRSILRQDPDKIMIGEIRDAQTVEIAIRAAITGHLVLSTIHTNDAASTVSRLLDMNVEPYMLSAALVGIIAQRLVRINCEICQKPYIPTDDDLAFLGIERSSDQVFYKGEGCSNCNNTGYKGRIGIHEVMMIGRNIRNMIQRSAPIDELRDYSRRHGMTTLKDECIRLVLSGVTSIDEAMAITFSQE